MSEGHTERERAEVRDAAANPQPVSDDPARRPGEETAVLGSTQE